MKRILSLFTTLLVTTIAAMAQTFTNTILYEFDGYHGDNEQQEMTITNNGDGTYNISLSKLNTYGPLPLELGSIHFEKVPGYTDEGITYIDGAKVTPEFTDCTEGISGNESSLYVKFNDSNAYLYFYGKLGTSDFGTRSWEITFGSEDNVYSIIEGNPIAELTNYTPNGSKFSYPLNINWDKQYLKAVINVTNCYEEYEEILSVGDNIVDHSNSWVFQYNKQNKKLYVDYFNSVGEYILSSIVPNIDGKVTIELSKAKGCVINGVAYNQVAGGANYDDEHWLENTSDFWTLTKPNVGSKNDDDDYRSHADYKYVTAIDNPDTPDTPKPFEPSATDYHTQAYVEYKGKATNITGGAYVTVEEYEKDKYSVTFSNLTDGTNVLGDLTIDNLTATTSEKGTQYNLTDESVATWNNVTESGIAAGIAENGSTATFSDFFCALGELANNDYNFALNFKVYIAGEELKVVFGQKAPVEVVDEKAYNVSMEITNSHEESVIGQTFENKTLVIKPLSDGTGVITLKDFPINDTETTDLAFTGTLRIDQNTGITHINANELSCTINDENCSLNGEVLYLEIYGSINDNGTIDMYFEIISWSGIVYMGKLKASNVISGINNATTNGNAANAQIYTIDGLKSNKLQKGINIIRKANGTTIKMIVK